MNSSLTYKLSRILAVFAAILICLSLCSCSEEVGIYRIDSLKWISDETATYSMNCTYTNDNKPSVITVEYAGFSDENYTDSFTYEDGEMVSVVRSYMSGITINLTPKKITSHKYMLYDEHGKEYLTIVFDQSGFIISYRYASGYVTEYAFTNDELGAPIAFKRLEIRPSGSNRLTEYTIEYQGKDTFIMKNKDTNSEESGYYEAKYTKIIVEE